MHLPQSNEAGQCIAGATTPAAGRKPLGRELRIVKVQWGVMFPRFVADQRFILPFVGRGSRMRYTIRRHVGRMYVLRASYVTACLAAAKAALARPHAATLWARHLILTSRHSRRL